MMPTCISGRRFVLLVVVLGTIGVATRLRALVASNDRPEGVSEQVFAPWNGTWRGTFTSYDIEGKERYKLDVTQVYESVGNGQQKGVFTVKSADGTVETVHAVNMVRDGELICRVVKIGQDEKPIGERTEHKGTYLGPGHIIWHSKIGEHGFETFNELVDGDLYTIHGAGVKSDDPRETEVFEGRYRRIKE